MSRMYFLVVGTYLSLVSASVYPTQPVQATVWSADQPMLVSWVDDWKYPVLSEMGPLDISLWCNTDTYLVQLASGVDPTTKTRQVTVPGWALRQSTYTLRFTTTKPVDVLIYSADFAIIPANTTMGSTASTEVGASAGMGSGAVALATPGGANTAAGTGTLVGSGFKTVPTASDAFSTGTTVAMTSRTSTNASGRFGSTTPSGVPPPSGTLVGSSASEGQRAANAGRRGVDVEKLKFRFVFVIWPVLMGITMAL